jgi:hypothetical protein
LSSKQQFQKTLRRFFKPTALNVKKPPAHALGKRLSTISILPDALPPPPVTISQAEAQLYAEFMRLQANFTIYILQLAENKRTLLWKAFGLMHKGCACALNAQPSNAVRMLTDGFAMAQSAGATLWMPFSRSHLARAYLELGNFEDAWRSIRSIREAMTMIERTTEAWCEAEVYQTAGEIMLLAPERDSSKAEAYFNCAITVAGAQQAKSWELRASMSLARLWRDQGKVGEARELLAPVYDWFTEGFDTRDLKDAKALLEELQSGSSD